MNGHWKKKNKTKKLNNAGMTLIELVVSFALLGLFMVAATKVISNTVTLYYSAKSITNGLQVSNIISAKIESELESALCDATIQTDCSMLITEPSSITTPDGEITGGSKVEFYDHSGSHLTIGLDENSYLVLHYFDQTNPSGAGDDWKFDDASYMGYNIKQLVISKAGAQYKGNILRVDLVLYSSKYGEYSSTNYIECYNYMDATDYGRIVVE